MTFQFFTNIIYSTNQVHHNSKTIPTNHGFTFGVYNRFTPGLLLWRRSKPNVNI